LTQPLALHPHVRICFWRAFNHATASAFVCDRLPRCCAPPSPAACWQPWPPPPCCCWRLALLPPQAAVHASCSNNRLLPQRCEAVSCVRCDSKLESDSRCTVWAGATLRPAALPLSACLCHLQANAPNVTASSATGGRFADALSVGAAAADWLPPGIFSGDGTAFSEAVPNSGKGFACSYRYLNDWASTHFAAMNSKQVRCGAMRCIAVWREGRGGAVSGCPVAPGGSLLACSAAACSPALAAIDPAKPITTTNQAPLSPPGPCPAVGQWQCVRALHHRLVRRRALPHSRQACAGADCRQVPRVRPRRCRLLHPRLSRATSPACGHTACASPGSGLTAQTTCRAASGSTPRSA
jgi:hypothetical protein